MDHARSDLEDIRTHPKRAARVVVLRLFLRIVIGTAQLVPVKATVFAQLDDQARLPAPTPPGKSPPQPASIAIRTA